MTSSSPSYGNDDESLSICDSSLSTLSRDNKHHHHRSNDDCSQHQELAKAEKARIFCFYRLFIILVLLLSMGAVAGCIYLYISVNQQESFIKQFNGEARKVLGAIGISLDQTLGATDALVFDLVSYANYSNSSWPFVTMPDFAVRAAKTLSLSRAIFIGVFPLVTTEQRKEWEAYSLKNDGWVAESVYRQNKTKNYYGPMNDPKEIERWGFIHDVSEFYKVNHTTGTNRTGPHLPYWQLYPVIPTLPVYNLDLYSYEWNYEGMDSSMENHKVYIDAAYMLPDENNEAEMLETETMAEWFKDFIREDEYVHEPISDVFYPIVDNVGLIDIFKDHEKNAGDNFTHTYNPQDNKCVGFVMLTIYWRDMLNNILPEGADGIIVVFENECNPTFTYEINGPRVKYLGREDAYKPNPKFKKYSISSNLWSLGSFDVRERKITRAPLEEDICQFTLTAYPSQSLYDEHHTSERYVYTAGAILIFTFTSALFIAYDSLVERRQRKVMQKAVKSSAIVSSLFPSLVRERLFGSESIEFLQKTKDNNNALLNNASLCPPVANLFPKTTVMFADIANFTAWSSAREPPQVFALLETLYCAFDEIARSRGVFKVETIGDCYVAVAGLPLPREDHAVVMVKFARDCRIKAEILTQKLEVTLGPDTGDLKLRFGLHSGPVTAGVLRGDKSRFQLFGDTVNTAARMEHLGKIGKIHASQSTAKLLQNAGKSHWLKPREHPVQAKGKGNMQTYWVETKRGSSHRCASSSTNTTLSDTIEKTTDNRSQRLINWNKDVLARILKQIIAHRSEIETEAPLGTSSMQHYPPTSVTIEATILDEVEDVIEFPIFKKSSKRKLDPSNIKLDDAILAQLDLLVTEIENNYKDNDFHNFQHASHVTMSVVKLLSQITGPEDHHNFPSTNKSTTQYHKNTFGITRDPLTRFACVFAALIHDVDHSGRSNGRLIQEGALIARLYNGKSIAEQNSIDVAWAIFMNRKYEELRNTLCPTKAEMQRFRQLVVNLVIATDILDKDLQKKRNIRWDRAFQKDGNTYFEESAQHMINQQATVVVEHMIQASDVIHTMQHWHIYRKWNEMLFEEMCKAYYSQEEGQETTKNPCDTWYKGEIAFFDSYIIPLANKLKDCGILGVVSEECLDFAQKNREEWKIRGQGIVKEMSKRFLSKLAKEQEYPTSIVETEEKVIISKKPFSYCENIKKEEEEEDDVLSIWA